MFGVYWSTVRVDNCQIVGNRFRELESTPGSIKLGATNQFGGNGFLVGPSFGQTD